MSSNHGFARGYRVLGVELLNGPSGELRRSEGRHESPRSDPPHREVASPLHGGRSSGEEVQFYRYDGEESCFRRYDDEEKDFHRYDGEEMKFHQYDSRDYKGSLSEPLHDEQREARASPLPTCTRSPHWVPMQADSQSGEMSATAPVPKRRSKIVRSPEQQLNRDLVHKIGRCSNCKNWKVKCDPGTPCESCLKNDRECIRPGPGQ